ncbi:hypothetical protein CTI12_AA440660 [Artemisia annua]|uniref:Uncharacterized protein n=1 Tax=Artemisia annua TaxID=35608 RepID=A0A2U1LY49_ARTAN|nr:hypothetical protein CTI12_AA440660 [Artemisia annua]
MNFQTRKRDNRDDDSTAANEFPNKHPAVTPMNVESSGGKKKRRWWCPKKVIKNKAKVG